jgi:hypothetical protein
MGNTHDRAAVVAQQNREAIRHAHGADDAWSHGDRGIGLAAAGKVNPPNAAPVHLYQPLRCGRDQGSKAALIFCNRRRVITDAIANIHTRIRRQTYAAGTRGDQRVD